MEKQLEHYVQAFSNLHVATRGGHASPHKPLMLLAVLSLADNGGLATNRIEYGPDLLELFREYFDVVQSERDQCSPLLPFFFLRGDRFWHHQPLPGREEVYQALTDPGGAAKLRAVVSHACLDDDLFQIVATPAGREVLRDTLIGRYFPQHREALLALCRREGDIGRYRETLEGRVDGRAVRETSEQDYGADVRDAAFRRTVTSAYDYRCAACGFRVLVDDLVLVDAAHLVPISELPDNDPRNGMALCKNHHWAMDRFLITPCTDHKWRVSECLQSRIPELAPLVELDGKTILLPGKRKYWPKEESLEWRMKRIRKPA